MAQTDSASEGSNGEEQSEKLTAKQRKAARYGPKSVSSSDSANADSGESDEEPVQ